MSVSSQETCQTSLLQFLEVPISLHTLSTGWVRLLALLLAARCLLLPHFLVDGLNLHGRHLLHDLHCLDHGHLHDALLAKPRREASAPVPSDGAQSSLSQAAAHASQFDHPKSSDQLTLVNGLPEGLGFCWAPIERFRKKVETRGHASCCKYGIGQSLIHDLTSDEASSQRSQPKESKASKARDP